MEILLAFVPSLIIGAVIVRNEMERRASIAIARRRGDDLRHAWELGFESGHSIGLSGRLYREQYTSREYLAALNWRWIDG